MVGSVSAKLLKVPKRSRYLYFTKINVSNSFLSNWRIELTYFFTTCRQFNESLTVTSEKKFQAILYTVLGTETDVITVQCS